MEKPLPIGVDDFAKLRRDNYYYVDKTGFIKELLDIKGEVNLFTRPRRFGKTLNLSMLRCFFEDTGTKEGNEENWALFEGLLILKAGEYYTNYMCKYPVISLSLKSAKQPDWQSAYGKLCRELTGEFSRHRNIMDRLAVEKKARYQSILEGTATAFEFSDALKFLSEALWDATGKKAIILIDEYDVPLESAYFSGFYPEMTAFIRSLFESALKTNPYLEFGVITGCLRITRESIFTGLNNMKMISILSDRYGEYFGFTQEEMDLMLAEYGLTGKRELIKKWYNGYRFGNTEVYNPWSAINYLDAARENAEVVPGPYWANTSSNDIVKSLVERADISVKGELENLIEGGTIEKPVHEDITYDSIYDSEDSLWNFLFFTGYLKMKSIKLQAETAYITMAIPNAEVKYIYKNTVRSWFDRIAAQKDLTGFIAALEQGNTKVVEREISDCLQETISFYDYAENYYHGFLTGLLKAQKKYRIVSNRESGLGRPDIVMKTASIRGSAVILELKSVNEYGKLEAGCRQALEQISSQRYVEGLQKEGYQNILAYGICFYKKECRVEKFEADI